MTIGALTARAAESGTMSLIAGSRSNNPATHIAPVIAPRIASERFGREADANTAIGLAASTMSNPVNAPNAGIRLHWNNDTQK